MRSLPAVLALAAGALSLSPAPPAPDCAGTACGCTQPALSTSAKNVLLVGDSISMPSPPSPGGYGLVVRTLLTNASYTNGTAVSVWHNGGWGNGGQAASTRKGMLCTNASTVGNWLNFTGTLDVVHFNFVRASLCCCTAAGTQTLLSHSLASRGRASTTLSIHTQQKGQRR